MGFAVVAQAFAVGVDQLHAVVDFPVGTALGVAVRNRHVRGFGQFGNLFRSIAVVGLREALHGSGTDVVAREEHFRQDQQVDVFGLQRSFTQALKVSRDIQRQGRTLIKGDAHGVLRCEC